MVPHCVVYKNYSDNESPGVTYTYKIKDTNEFSAVLKHKNSSYKVGDTLSSFDKVPSIDDVIAYLNKEDITSAASIEVKIVDSSGNEVDEVDSSVEGTYTITYNISYEKFTKTLTRKVTIIKG